MKKQPGVNPLLYPCPRCKAKAGVKCKTGTGKDRCPHPERGLNYQVGRRRRQGELFGE